MHSKSEWDPVTILRWVGAYGTSTGIAQVVTDAGEGYLKAIGNPAGEHALACEWVGTNLACNLGLPTFDFSIIRINEMDDITLGNGKKAKPGPAFITRAEKGFSWGGDEKALKKVVNKEDITRLVVLDTWIMNRDRHHPDTAKRNPNYDNVFMSFRAAPKGKHILKAIDHTHCLTHGDDLTPAVANIEQIRDQRVYGLFPAFLPFINPDDAESSVADLQAISRETIEEIIDQIPKEWDVSERARNALKELVVKRQGYVGNTILGKLFPNRQMRFDLKPTERNES